MILRIPVAITGGMLPDKGMNIWHARIGDVGQPTAGDIDVVATWIKSFYFSIKGLYPSGCTIAFDGETQQIATQTPATLPTATAWTHAATGAANALPAANALMVSWRTSLATRRGRGRTFIGPLVQSTAELNGTPESSNRSALQNAVNTLVASSTGAQAGGKALGVWSPSDGVLRDIIAGNVPDRFGVIRSRRD